MPDVTEQVVEGNATITASIGKLIGDRSGATAIEYGLIAALMALVCIASFTALGGSSGGGWNGMANKVTDAMNK